MNAKDEKSEVFSYFKKAKGKFIVRSHTFLRTKGILTHLGICVKALMCAR